MGLVGLSFKRHMLPGVQASLGIFPRCLFQLRDSSLRESQQGAMAQDTCAARSYRLWFSGSCGLGLHGPLLWRRAAPLRSLPTGWVRPPASALQSVPPVSGAWSTAAGTVPKRGACDPCTRNRVSLRMTRRPPHWDPAPGPGPCRQKRFFRKFWCQFQPTACSTDRDCWQRGLEREPAETEQSSAMQRQGNVGGFLRGAATSSMLLM